MGDENKLKYFFMKASKDMELRDQFLRDPVSVAERYNIAFTDRQLEKIKKTSAFIESLNELEWEDIPWWDDPGNVYPADPILTKWKIQELINVASQLHNRNLLKK